MPVTQSIQALSDELRRDGVVALDDLVPESVLEVMRRGCAELIGRTERMRISTEEWQLEAEGEGGGWAARAAGKECIPGKVRIIGRAHEHSADLAAVPDLVGLNEKLIEPLHGLPGDFYDCFLWAKPSRVGSQKPWHQDAIFLADEWHEKYVDVYTIWIAVDDAREDNGCLRFLPGSHRERKLYEPDGIDPGDIFASPREPSLDIARIWPGLTPVTLPRKAGSALLFNGYVAHTSAPNTTEDDRRAVSYCYSLPRHPAGPESGR
ncbi:phytanoyl-CoA dioxygenase family protein [Streptantibioticus cattleyicolor]|uniref:Putative hydroxylase n=2 Tax=Streptantibioticus cattleyicolor TaxID=29303 RepID=F8JND5_STREN|nr:phytanoyl-CoA dioxygenase family protein [Streptantibioticus cattleyicolor]AEW99102.1 putative hydroxylase [Streptantibioticus cattleyicolor NRRL 8057 = DSM 46488]CAD18975.1 putative hydroxylase [Streptantibioticus cattleyicolor]CCB71852.1 Oxidoreductase [Streptantibioticus cattleyicolor NRRL 8057 = DSM 46488]